jgi:hypothetical protein
MTRDSFFTEEKPSQSFSSDTNNQSIFNMSDEELDQYLEDLLDEVEHEKNLKRNLINTDESKNNLDNTSSYSDYEHVFEKGKTTEPKEIAEKTNWYSKAKIKETFIYTSLLIILVMEIIQVVSL